MSRRRETRRIEPPSAYRLMWVIVLCDLPVTTAEQRRVAGRFRIYLKSLGFDRVQYSVYMRDGGTPVQTEAITQRVIKGCPRWGMCTSSI